MGPRLSTPRRPVSSFWYGPFDGRFADRDWPWIRACDRPGWFWVDADAILTFTPGLCPGGERRVLALVAALIGNIPLEDLGSVRVRA